MARRLLRLGPLELMLADPAALKHVTAQLPKVGLPSIFDPATTWYAGWYFRLRLEEEISRSRRYEFALALLAISLEAAPGAMSLERMDLNSALRQLCETGFRTTDIPGVVDKDHLAVALPQTDRDGINIVMSRVAAALQPYKVELNHATLDESTTGAKLIDQAFQGNLAPSRHHAE